MGHKIVFSFSGQGSQKPLMGKDLYQQYPEARMVFEEVDQAVGYRLTDVIFDQNPSSLGNTFHAQPAIMAVSMACLRVIEKRVDTTYINKDNTFIGHSVGEYTALCAAGGMDLYSAAKLLSIRGACINRYQTKSTGMMALIGGNLADIEQMVVDLRKSKVDIFIANDNSPEQVVVSGLVENLHRAEEASSKYNIKKCIALRVGHAFHSPLVSEAAVAFQEESATEMSKISKPIGKFFSSSAVRFESNPVEIKKILLQQITAPILWRQSCLILFETYNRFIEMGPNNALTSLTKRCFIGDQIFCTNVSNVTDIDGFLSLRHHELSQ